MCADGSATPCADVDLRAASTSLKLNGCYPVSATDLADRGVIPEITGFKVGGNGHDDGRS